MSDTKPKKNSSTPPKRRESRNSVSSTTSNNSKKSPEKSDTPSPITLQLTPDTPPTPPPNLTPEKTPSRESTPKKGPETPPSETPTPVKAVIIEIEEPVEEIIESTKDLITKEIEETIEVSTTIEIKTTEENGIEKNGDYESDETESELEKLSVGTPDVERNGSPVLLSRSATRRSEFRNIPTPKTPKVVTNGDDFEDSTTLPESPDVSIVFTDSEFTDEPSQLTTNSSTGATYGDFTRISSDIESPRDLSYLKTLKVISGRKTLNDMRQSPRFVSGRTGKRKLEEFDFEESKRVKTESDDSGLFSYVSSPISTLKSKFYRFLWN